MKKTLSLLLAVIMIIGLVPLGTISAFAANPAIVKVESVSAIPDSTVDVAISITDNPGIASMGFTMSFDESLTLVGATNGEAFSELTMTPPAQLKKTGSVTGSCRFAWLGSDNVTEDGVILNLKFKVSNDAELNKNCVIFIACEKDDVLDENRTAVPVTTQNGKVTIISYTPGDVDGNSTINMLDVLTLCQFYVDGCRYDPNGYAVNINPESGDVDANGKVNMLDVLMICQYYVDGCKYDPAGYGVILLPGKKACEHSMQHFNAKEATCTESGNIEYWYCDKCNDYFADAAGNDVITIEYTIVEAKGHHEIADEGTPATPTTHGYTAGVWCDRCETWISGHESINPIAPDESNISYRHYVRTTNANGDVEIVYDSYLSTHEIVNPNPNTYIEGVGIDELIEGVKTDDGKQVSANGYRFLGWYEKPEATAKRVYSISPDEKGNKILYGIWSKEEYTIIFDNTSMNLPSSTKTYTVDQKIPLDKPSVDRYVFLGWTTDRDELVSEIKPGTTGNFTLHSNWTSKRNLAKPVANLGSPLIVEDTVAGRILFTYEIGQVENVPLYTIKNLPSAGGVVSVYTETVTKAIGTTDASTVAKAIDHITTDSTAWTLSEDWNETTHIEDSVLNEHGYDRKTGTEVGKTSSNTYTLTTNEYDNTVVKANEGSVATTTQYNTKDVDSRETWESKANLSVSDTQSAKYTDSAKVSAEVGVGYGPVSAKVGASAETSTEISSSTTAGASAETTIAHENSSHSKTGTDTVTVADNTKTTTSDKGWSKTTNSTSSSSSSLTQYEEQTLSEKIAEEYKYGQSYAKGGSNSNSAAWSTSLGESDQYSSTLTYFNSEETTEGVSYTINGETDGSYRLVRAGIVHVFAVVIYDIANAQYSVATYAVLDDETYTYIDYSATSAAKFDDNQNGVLPFEIPYSVNDYVNGRIVATEGLEYSEATLSTGEYDGNNTSVIIPEFFSVDNQDGTNSAYTVRHISAETFSGNTDLKSVLLSNYIREIPDSAFAGCTSLQFVYGSEISSIGNYAFDGCTSLGDFKVASTITSIGENAFRGVKSIVVDASSKEVVFGAINSGAKRITINISAISDDMNNITLEIPDTVEYFELQGGRNTFKGLKIKSDAKETILNGITITNSTGIPLEISSENVTFNQVIVESPSYVLLLKSHAPNVTLYGTSRLISSSENAMVCRNVTFDKISSNVTSKLEVTGNVLYYGKLNNTTLISFSERGEMVSLTADEFEKYIKGSFSIIFDSNGGAVEKDNMIAYVGTEIGNLPVPVRDYYTFDGWFTTADGGQKVTSSTVFNSAENITLFAHWTQNSLSNWVLATEVPTTAQVVNEKWGYTLREFTDSSKSSLSGWTPNGSDWKWSDYGSWSGWSTSSASTSDSRQVETKTVTDRAAYTNYRYWVYRSSDGYAMGTKNFTIDGRVCNVYDEINITWALNGPDSSGLYGTYQSQHPSYSGKSWCNRWFFGEATYVPAATHTEYRYRDRSKIYTYHYYKDSQLEATSDPTGQANISNVVKYVQYRAK